MPAWSAHGGHGGWQGSSQRAACSPRVDGQAQPSWYGSLRRCERSQRQCAGARSGVLGTARLGWGRTQCGSRQLMVFGARQRIRSERDPSPLLAAVSQPVCHSAPPHTRLVRTLVLRQTVCRSPGSGSVVMIGGRHLTKEGAAEPPVSTARNANKTGGGDRWRP